MTGATKDDLIVTLRDITRQLMAITYSLEEERRREDAMFDRILAEIRERAPDVAPVGHDFAPPPDGVMDDPPSTPLKSVFPTP